MIGEKKESEGMRDDMKMTLIERWNDGDLERKRQQSVLYL